MAVRVLKKSPEVSLESEYRKVAAEIAATQYALRNPNKVDEHGVRLSKEAYWEWRKATIIELRAKQKRRDELKIALTVQATESDTELLKSAYNLLETLRRDDVDFDPQEAALIDRLRNRFHSGG